MQDGSARRKLEDNVQYLKKRFEESAKKYGITAMLRGHGGHLHWYFADKIENYRDAASENIQNYMTFAEAMLEQGIFVIPKPLSHHAISVSHDENVIEKIAVAMDHALEITAEKNN